MAFINPNCNVSLTPCLGHVNRHVIRDRAEERVIAFALLKDATRNAGMNGAVGDEPRDEPLPRHRRRDAAHAVQPKRPVPRHQNFFGTNRRGLWGNPTPIAAKTVQRVLHDRHRVQLDDSAVLLLVTREVADEIETQMRLPKRDVAAPSDSAITAIHAAAVLHHLMVILDVFVRREVDVLFLGTELFLDSVEKVFPHGRRKRAFPLGGSGSPILIRVFVHVEGRDVVARKSQAVDHLCGNGELRYRTDGQNCREFFARLARRRDPRNKIGREGAIKLRSGFDHANLEIGILVLGNIRPLDLAHPLARLGIAKGDEFGKVGIEAFHKITFLESFHLGLVKRTSRMVDC